MMEILLPFIIFFYFMFAKTITVKFYLKGEKVGEGNVQSAFNFCKFDSCFQSNKFTLIECSHK